MRTRRHPGFDVHAHESLEGRPRLDGENWLLVCRECGWHVETAEGWGWKGCPGCNAELWVVFEEGSPWDSPQLLSGCSPDLKPRRRRNAWRTAMPTAEIVLPSPDA